MIATPFYIRLIIFWKSFLFIAYLHYFIKSSFGFPNLKFDDWLMNFPSTFIESPRKVVLRFLFSIYSRIFWFWFIISPYDFLNCLRFATAIELSPLTRRNLILLTAYAISVLIEILVCESFSMFYRVDLSLDISLVGKVNVDWSSLAPTYSMRSCTISPRI